ncbi:MAG: DNRLRE domain-containing protein [Planctomycetota bacterium]
MRFIQSASDVHSAVAYLGPMRWLGLPFALLGCPMMAAAFGLLEAQSEDGGEVSTTFLVLFAMPFLCIGFGLMFMKREIRLDLRAREVVRLSGVFVFTRREARRLDEFVAIVHERRIIPGSKSDRVVFPVLLESQGADTAVATMPFTSVAPNENLEIVSSADNMIYSDATNSSNGAGARMVVGRINAAGLRRGLLSFDVDGNMPAGSTINTARLRLVHRAPPLPFFSGTQTLIIRRVTAAWTEGTADSGVNAGQGVVTAGGGATWVNRTAPGTAWTTAGGDFAAPSGSLAISDTYTTFTSGSTAGLVSDVQGWLDTPANNFGWILIGNESSTATVKWLGTRESGAADRPRLVLNITRPLP